MSVLTRAFLLSILVILPTLPLPLSANDSPAVDSVLRTVKSRNFHVLTDLSQEESEKLLIRLETMLRLISAYWGRPHRGVIQMYVAEDFSRWPAKQIALMDPKGAQSIRGGGGLTISRTRVLGNAFESLAVVYAVAEGGTPQHEAVHAYCTHAFGNCGPVWYAEGMAEVGCYWQEKDDKSVHAPPHVIEFLKRQDPKPLQAIVDNPLETSGDSWQNYASRWALCHLLGHNRNYTVRFKPLGLQLLNLSAQDVSFWQVYGNHAAEIEFEYRLFLQNIEPGYRVDLCSWDWKTKFTQPRGGRPLVSRISADRGWQASRVHVVAETSYDFTTDGSWKIEADGPSIDADGTGEGSGQLVGAIFDNYTLSDPFSLGAEGSFTAPATGDLVLRCADGWGSLTDNHGTMTVRIKSTDSGRPTLRRRLARPASPKN